MRYLSILISFLLLQYSTASQAETEIQDEIKTQVEPTVIYIVRHAEKMSDGTNDPDLNELGIKRAGKLAVILKNIELFAIYSSPYKRTQQTAKPVADSKNLEISPYNPSKQKAFVAELLKLHNTQTILIVGHSNTIPELLNILSSSDKYQQLDDNEYDKLFVVTIDEKGKITVKVEVF